MNRSQDAQLSEQLVSAVRRRSANEVCALIEQGANPNARERESTLSPLMFAAGIGEAEIVRLLIASGAWVNALDGRAGATALHKACQGGHLETVRALVEAGGFIDVQTTTTGHTPLMEAIWFMSDSIVEYLLNRGARIELRTYYGFTIDDHIDYELRVSQGESGQRALHRIQDLVQQRRATDEQRKSAGGLNRAVLAGDLNAVREALKSGAQLEERYPIVGSFSDGHTPLLIAARDGYVEIVDALIQAGADVNAVEPVFGAVPLHKATYNGRLEITRLLANAPKVNLNYQGPSNGYTPLHDALWHGYPDIAQALVDAGARVDLVGYDGKRPIDIATEVLGKHHSILRSLA